MLARPASTAGKRVLLLAESLIASAQSFTVETTLSGSTYLRMAQRAKEFGYNVVVVFVGTASIEINLERVKVQVEKVGMMRPKKISADFILEPLQI